MRTREEREEGGPGIRGGRGCEKRDLRNSEITRKQDMRGKEKERGQEVTEYS